MRIYFNSSFSCGKTTAKKWVASAYKLEKIPEIFRTVIAEREFTDLNTLRANVDLLTEVQIETIQRQFDFEYKIRNNFAACRGIDTLAFLIEFGDKNKIAKYLQSKEVNDYVNWLKEEDVKTFLIKPEKELIKADGLRDTDWDLSLQIYGSVKSILSYYGIPYIPITSPNMADRQAVIKATLGEPK